MARGDREAENALKLECPPDIAEDEQYGAPILGRRQPGEAFAEPQSQRHRHLV
ncbi:hypothetical protein COLINT_03351 [Collinsella intestinalis DSM 13280]|uniref:Uncharacterized protein n=1 Tax=Collinsella intestinalis DSM 13280 TaxID=521003 RepID=C4FB98_9ACTN|nr:hypothetical protein COLINT_03351 [Collinsella intestinalis DSM 13280]